MKKIIAVIALTLISQAAVAATIKAEVKGMVCAFCAQGIEKKLKSLNQTQDVFVDLKKRIVAVELKDQQTLPTEDFTKIIQDAGYDVSKVEVVEQPLSAIKAELKAEAAK
jgi:mercuric ion binding protein